MNVDDLQRLDDNEFADELNEHLGFRDPVWDLFAAHLVARRTAAALETLKASLEMQLSKNGADGEWAGRTQRLLTLVELRLKQAHRIVHNIDGAGAAREKKLRAVLYQVCYSLADSDAAEDLRYIAFPLGEPVMSLDEWMGRREQKRLDANLPAEADGFEWLGTDEGEDAA